MAGHEDRLVRQIDVAVFLEDRDHRHADRHKRRLGILGQAQRIVRALEHQTAELLLQGVVDLLEHQARHRECLGEVAAHTDRLRPLAGKHECTFHVVMGPSPQSRRAQ